MLLVASKEQGDSTKGVSSNPKSNSWNWQSSKISSEVKLFIQFQLPRPALGFPDTLKTVPIILVPWPPLCAKSLTQTIWERWILYIYVGRNISEVR